MSLWLSQTRFSQGTTSWGPAYFPTTPWGSITTDMRTPFTSGAVVAPGMVCVVQPEEVEAASMAVTLYAVTNEFTALSGTMNVGTATIGSSFPPFDLSTTSGFVSTSIVAGIPTRVTFGLGTIALQTDEPTLISLWVTGAVSGGPDILGILLT